MWVVLTTVHNTKIGMEEEISLSTGEGKGDCRSSDCSRRGMSLQKGPEKEDQEIKREGDNHHDVTREGTSKKEIEGMRVKGSDWGPSHPSIPSGWHKRKRSLPRARRKKDERFQSRRCRGEKEAGN